MSVDVLERRRARHERFRKRMVGTAEQPRLCVSRSGKHLYAQAIDDYSGRTLYAFSTLNTKFKQAVRKGNTVEASKKLGEMFGPELLKKGIQKIVFDRGGNRYHGRVKALAESLRQAGLTF